MGGQVTVALGIGLYFLCLFKAPCHWSISPNRGGTFLRENSNGFKVGHYLVWWETELDDTSGPDTHCPIIPQKKSRANLALEVSTSSPSLFLKSLQSQLKPSNLCMELFKNWGNALWRVVCAQFSCVSSSSVFPLIWNKISSSPKSE